MFEIFVEQDFDFVVVGQFRRQLFAREDDDGGNVRMVDTLSQHFTTNEAGGASNNDLHFAVVVRDLVEWAQIPC